MSDLAQGRGQGLGDMEPGGYGLPSPSPSDLDFLSLTCPPHLSALDFLSPFQVNKTLKATLQALLEVVALEDGDVLDSFQASPSTESLKSTSSDPGARQAGRRRGQQQETETFYIMVGKAGLREGRGGAHGVPGAGTKTLGSFWGLPRSSRSTLVDGASLPSYRPSMRNCRRRFSEVGPTPGSLGPFHPQGQELHLPLTLLPRSLT